MSNGKEIFCGRRPNFAERPNKNLAKFARCVKLFEPEKNGRAGVAELADAPDLGSGGFTVGVQVPSPAPLLIGRLRGFLLPTFLLLFIGQITVRLGPVLWKDFPLKNIPLKCFSSATFARTIAYRSVKRFSFYRPFYFLFIGQITVRLGLPFFGRDFPLKNIPLKCFSSATSPAPLLIGRLRGFPFTDLFFFVYRSNHGSPRAPVLWKGLPFEKHSPEMFFFGNFARTASEQVTLVPIFYFIKISHPLSLFLLIRKGSRSRRLLICKRIRNAFGSLPTLCENAFGIVTVDFTVFSLNPLKAHTKKRRFSAESCRFFLSSSLFSLCFYLFSLNRRFQRIVKSEE